MTDSTDAFEKDVADLTRPEFEELVVKLAWMDRDFRNRLITDPKKTLAEDIGFEVPDGWTINIVQESNDSMTLVLPHFPEDIEDSIEDFELDDSELQDIAGGATLGCTGTSNCTIVGPKCPKNSSARWNIYSNFGKSINIRDRDVFRLSTKSNVRLRRYGRFW